MNYKNPKYADIQSAFKQRMQELIKNNQKNKDIFVSI